MRIVIIGGSGHIGTYLAPRLVRSGHHVILVSRGKQQPYAADDAWSFVETVQLDRQTEEAAGSFGRQITSLHGDVVIDLISFTLASTQQLVEALTGHVQHFLSCGTIWVHGTNIEVPVQEHQSRSPFGSYGIQKAEMEAYLLEEARLRQFPATVVHPGHIVGPGYAPINPVGHKNLEVFAKLARGEELKIPHFGAETIHHVHADDVAQVFEKAVVQWGAAVGESFHAVSAQALNLKGFAEQVASWFGQKPRLCFVSWEEWAQDYTEAEVNTARDHLMHSPNLSIAKAQRLLDYQPRYSSLQAVRESLDSLIREGQLTI